MDRIRCVAIFSCALLGACGRIGFAPSSNGDDTNDAGADARADAGSECNMAVRGSVCSGGAIVAGSWGGRDYMVTPSGCTDGTTPTCDGSTDTLTKTWFGTNGMFTNIPGVENRLGAAPSSQLGDVNTEVAATDASVTADSAVRYCYDLDYGGYTDWYLPASSELIEVLLCHSNATLNPIYPSENPGCATGGRSMELTGFALATYWSSTETDSGGTAAMRLNFSIGVHGDNFKDRVELVRCIRYGS